MINHQSAFGAQPLMFQTMAQWFWSQGSNRVYTCSCRVRIRLESRVFNGGIATRSPVRMSARVSVQMVYGTQEGVTSETGVDSFPRMLFSHDRRNFFLVAGFFSTSKL